jgi:hypothetical protein
MLLPLLGLCVSIQPPGHIGTFHKAFGRRQDVKHSIVDAADHGAVAASPVVKPVAASPVVFNLGATMTRSIAISHCEAQQKGGRLCAFHEVCPLGGGNAPFNGALKGDTWTPILRPSPGGWLQIGPNRMVCKGHGGDPGWEEDTNGHDFRGPLFCCAGVIPEVDPCLNMTVWGEKSVMDEMWQVLQKVKVWKPPSPPLLMPAEPLAPVADGKGASYMS